MVTYITGFRLQTQDCKDPPYKIPSFTLAVIESSRKDKKINGDIYSRKNKTIALPRLHCASYKKTTAAYVANDHFTFLGAIYIQIS